MLSGYPMSFMTGCSTNGTGMIGRLIIKSVVLAPTDPQQAILSIILRYSFRISLMVCAGIFGLNDKDALWRILSHAGKISDIILTLGRRLLEGTCCVFSPDTILKWHRRLVAHKYDGSKHRRKVGRPRIARTLEDLIVRIASENPSWGYYRIEGQIKILGYNVSRTTIGRVLLRRGFDPDLKVRKRTTWKEFIRSHWESLAAIDFFTVEIHTWRGLARYMVLFAVELSSRKVEIAGIIPQADGRWMKQMSRNLTDPMDGFLTGKRYLIHDRDPLFTKEFVQILKDAGVQTVKTPKRSPNLKDYASYCT